MSRHTHEYHLWVAEAALWVGITEAEYRALLDRCYVRADSKGTSDETSSRVETWVRIVERKGVNP